MITIDPKSVLFSSVKATTDISTAVQILRANDITDPVDIQQYLTATHPQATTPTPLNNNQNGNGVSMNTVLQVPQAAGGFGSMAGFNPQAVLRKVGPSFLAGFMQYEVFDKGVHAGETGKGKAMLGLFFAGAVAATMLWLSKLGSQTNKDYSAITEASNSFHFGKTIEALLSVIKNGYFTIDYLDPAFWYTVAVATAITAAVLALGVIIGTRGAKDAPTTSIGDTVAAAFKDIPEWFNTLPKTAAIALTGGLVVGGTAFNLTPGTLYREFSVNTVQLAAAIPSTNPGAANSGGIVPSILYSPGLGPNGTDLVYLVSPGSNGDSNIKLFAVDSNGYVVGPDGPDSSYLPFFQPIMTNGKVTGVKQNPGSLQAIKGSAAYMAMANDTSLSAAKRQAAVATSSRSNKSVTFVATPN